MDINNVYEYITVLGKCKQKSYENEKETLKSKIRAENLKKYQLKSDIYIAITKNDKNLKMWKSIA
ncbi:MAG: hypothetical protein Q4D65_00715 [Peptostreptococcaceae bacterium]|nr:hypothetical protein [Peptostreptococcaceae bacterium]